MRGLAVPLLIVASGLAAAETPAPIIDMHLHASPVDANGPPPLGLCAPFTEFPLPRAGESWETRFIAWQKEPPCTDPVWSPETDEALMRQTIVVMQRRNVYGVLSGTPARVRQWSEAAPVRFIAGMGFQLGRDAITPAQMRDLHAAGAFEVLAEVTNQYQGIGPSDPRFDPYLQVAEELDIPVGIHVGTGPPGAPYLGLPNYRAALHSPLTLEDALLRHPKLRVCIMHAGWPMLDDLLAVLWAHPQVYAEVGAIVFALPRPEFHRYLQRIVEAGFGKRIMFGSDQMVWPGLIERGIAAIESASFLTPGQKRDILYENAVRFLRLTDAADAVRARHSGSSRRRTLVAGHDQPGGGGDLDHARAQPMADDHRLADQVWCEPVAVAVERDRGVDDGQLAVDGGVGNHPGCVELCRLQVESDRADGDERARFSFMGSGDGPLSAFVTYDVTSGEILLERRFVLLFLARLAQALGPEGEDHAGEDADEPRRSVDEEVRDELQSPPPTLARSSTRERCSRSTRPEPS